MADLAVNTRLTFLIRQVPGQLDNQHYQQKTQTDGWSLGKYRFQTEKDRFAVGDVHMLTVR